MLFEQYDPLKISKEGGKNILPEGNLFQILDLEGRPNEIFLKEDEDKERGRAQSASAEASGFATAGALLAGAQSASARTSEGASEIRDDRAEDELYKKMYEEMVFIRFADDKFSKLQRQGRMGTYAAMKGQEAAQIGSVHALEKSDWLVPAFRELGAMHLHGVPLEKMYQYWGGFEVSSQMPPNVNVLPVSIPVGSHMLHAVGLAWAMKLQKKPQIAITYFSDGATSTGDFHEAMNFAGVFKTPCIFFCQNNQYAISVPRKKQTASKTLAQKAVAYGFPGIQVDGNDVLAAYAVTEEAVRRARKGEGPFLIEAVTYRQADHTTADDARKYRPKEEEDYWALRDPIERFKKYLKLKNLWSEEWQKKVEENSQKKVSEAVEKYEATPIPPVEDVFKYVYGEMTPQQAEQLQYVKRFYP